MPNVLNMTDWTIGKVLNWATEDFKSRGIASARLDAELLLAYLLNTERIFLYTNFDRPLEEAELASFRQTIIRRRKGEPLAYITGTKEFWSMSFEVSPSVLIPRPDTETLVEAAISRMGDYGTALDLCTGTGCVAAALASEKTKWKVDAVDISHDAVLVAKRNIERLGMKERVNVFKGDLFEPVASMHYDIITANPPYIPDEDIPNLQKEVLFEPQLALSGGKDGLDLARRIIEQASDFLNPGGFLLMELDPFQFSDLLDNIAPRFFTIKGIGLSDLSGSLRVAVLKKDSLPSEQGAQDGFIRD